METFFESGLKPELLRAIDDLGFVKPTPIQVKTLSTLDNPEGDLVALAQTGTGKTAAFGLPLLNSVNSRSKDTQVIVLSPTRELCIQITEDLKSFAKYLEGIYITPVYGGAPLANQARFLNKGSQIVVGTPGRVLDMIKRGILKLENINWFVLDEADEMLNMGFKDELEAIFQNTPEEKSTWLFSATMPAYVEKMAGKYMNSPTQISVGKRNQGATNVEHQYVMVKAADRYEALRRIVDAEPELYGVVFCRTRRDTNELAQKLSKGGYPAQALNGDLSQTQRDSVMRNFRSRSLRLLVATDVAARGIDVDDLTHVINYALPDDPEVYVHRSGRTGRAGKSGICLSILHNREHRKLKEIEKMVGKKLALAKIPTQEEIIRGRVLGVGEDLRYANTDHVDFENLKAEMNLLLDDLSKDQLVEQITHFALKSLNFDPLKSRDINVSHSKSDRSDDRQKRKDRKPKREERRGPREKEKGFATLEVNIGYRQELKPNRLMGVINEMMGTDRVRFGRIDIDRETTLLDVEEKYAQEVAMTLSGLNFHGRAIDVVFVSNPGPRPSRKPKSKPQGYRKFKGKSGGGRPSNKPRRRRR